MNLDHTNRLLAAIPSASKVQAITASASVNPYTDVVLVTGDGGITVTLPACAEVPGRIIAVINAGTSDNTIAEATAGEGIVALSDVTGTAGTADVFYSTGLCWTQIA